MQVINFRELSGKLTSRAFLFPAEPGVFRLIMQNRLVLGWGPIFVSFLYIEWITNPVNVKIF